MSGRLLVSRLDELCKDIDFVVDSGVKAQERFREGLDPHVLTCFHAL